MDRVLKFRVWDDVDKLMFYFDDRGFGVMKARGFVMVGGVKVTPEGSLSYLIDSGRPVMQFTGIQDGNGKRIV